jgi:opacity protein-like surface antigen
MKKLVSLAFLGLFVFSVPALAGIEKGQGEVGVDYGSTSYSNDAADFDTSDSLSLRGGYFFTNLFQLEGQYISSDTTVTDFDAKASTDIMMVNGVFNFMPGKEIKPYVLVGIGQASTDVKDDFNSVDDSGTAYQIGAGSRFFFGKSKRTAFRFDVSMINQDTFEEATTNTTVAGGFTFRLGK